MDKALKSLQQRHLEWIDIVNRGDGAAYSRLLADEGIWIPPQGDPIIGREAFRKWLSPFFEKYSYNFSIKDEQFLMRGRWAIEKGKFTTVMTPEDGDEMKHSGTFTVIWYRNDAGKWLIDRYVDDTNF